MIRVLVVEDSPVVRQLLTHILGSDPEIEIAGVAANGEEALDAVKAKKPNVITMDINMPRMDGFEATRRIMETQPTPIVIVTGSARARELATTFRAVEAGALAVIKRPESVGDPESDRTARELVQTVKLMSEVKVIRRWARLKKDLAGAQAPIPGIVAASADIRIVAIGASTGGPAAIHAVLRALPKDFPVPVLIVQHMAQGLIGGFAEWLTASSGFPVRVASDCETARAGTAYVAPDKFHMTIRPDYQIRLTEGEDVDNGVRPSVGRLFRSVAESFGSEAAGVLLTGMGRDGARELRMMKDKNAVTIAQDEETSVIYGMPREALNLGGVTYVLPLSRIGPALTELLSRRPSKDSSRAAVPAVSQTGAATVLVAEDSPTQAQELKNILERQSYRVFVAADGEEALAMARQLRPTILISDIVMPRMDGYELCRRIKADPQLKGTPVMLLTALSDPEDVIRGLECGADNFITKPYTEESLIPRVVHMTTNSQLREGGPVQPPVAIFFSGRKHVINSDRIQILNLLLSVYETAMTKNRELAGVRDLLSRLNDRLEQKVDEVKLLNESLSRHASELETAYQELESFSYSVSHDLRAPLRAIDGFSKMLLEDHSDKLEKDAQELVLRVRKACERMAHLIEDLLGLSRVGRAAMNEVPVDLSSMARAITADLQNSDPRRKVQFNIAQGLVARGDRGLLELVLRNLLGNAFKFTARQPRPIIEFGCATINGIQTCYVRDNGAGFDMKYATKLFAPFQRLHSEADFPGTGIGLATVQRIIRRHRGKVWAEGTVGEGATFYFTIGQPGNAPGNTRPGPA